MDILSFCTDKDLFLFCDKKIKSIHNKYPEFMRSCLYSHVDFEVLDRLYEICHILMTGETRAESDRRNEIEKAQKHYNKMLRKKTAPCVAPRLPAE